MGSSSVHSPETPLHTPDDGAFSELHLPPFALYPSPASTQETMQGDANKLSTDRINMSVRKCSKMFDSIVYEKRCDTQCSTVL